MKKSISSICKKYSRVIYGIIVVATGYFTTHINHFDFSNSINHFFPFIGEHRNVDEIVFWLGILLIFIFSNYLSIKKERNRNQVKMVHESMLYASNHIIRNLLNQMHLVRFEAEESIDFDKDVLELFNCSVREAETLIDQVSKISELNDESIHNSLYIKTKDIKTEEKCRNIFNCKTMQTDEVLG